MNLFGKIFFEIEKILSVTKTKDTDTAKKKISLDDFIKELFD